MQKFYKIRDKETGLFSSGGQYPQWTTKGKVWNSIGTLKQHLAMHHEKIESARRSVEFYKRHPNTQNANRYNQSSTYESMIENDGINMGIRNNWEVVEIEFIESDVIDAREFYYGN